MQVFTSEHYDLINQKYRHLLEVSLIPDHMEKEDQEWLVRDGYDTLGTLMVGDLRVLHAKTDILEIHPFPEWVVQLFRPGKPSGSVYAIVPNFKPIELSKFAQTEWHERQKMVQATLNELAPDDFLMIKYEIGVCLKIPANVPHEFLALTTQDQQVPYCQVFEPNTLKAQYMLAIKPTRFFTLKKKINLLEL